MENEKISLELSPHEALVLFEWLSRNDEKGTVVVEHAAEQQVLWTVEGQVERELTAQFAPEYRTLLDEARRKVLADGPSTRGRK